MAKPDSKLDFALLQQQQALMFYLESLLLEVTPAPDNAAEPVPQPAPQPSLTNPPARVAVPETPQFPMARGPVSCEQLAVVAKPLALGGMPSWATPPYQVLSFELGDIEYAVSLQHLYGIIPLPELTKLPTSIPWFVGVFRHRSHNVKLVDLSLILDPDRKPARKMADNLDQGGFVLLLDEGRWGFLARRVINIMSLDADSVQWRREHTARGVVVGTVVDRMWTLLDLDRLVDGLIKGIWAPERKSS